MEIGRPSMAILRPTQNHDAPGMTGASGSVTVKGSYAFELDGNDNVDRQAVTMSAKKLLQSQTLLVFFLRDSIILSAMKIMAMD